MTSTEQVFRTIVEDVVGRGDVALAERLFADDFVPRRTGLHTMFGFYGPGGPPPALTGKQAFLGGLGRIKASFPDWRCEIDQVVCDGEVAAGSFTVHATFDGDEPFLGFAPTGRTLTIAEAGFLRVRDGQAVEGWFVGDELSVLAAVSDLVPVRTASVGAGTPR